MKVICAIFMDMYPQVIRAISDGNVNEVTVINTWLADHNQPGQRKPMFFTVTQLENGQPTIGMMVYLVQRDSISDPGHVQK